MKYLIITNTDVYWAILFLVVMLITGAWAFPGKSLGRRRKRIKSKTMRSQEEKAKKP